MPVKAMARIIGLILIGILIIPLSVLAVDPPATTPPPAADRESQNFFATRPSECISKEIAKKLITPANCIYLEEPIGGRPNYDLFLIGPCYSNEEKKGCEYKLWGGEAIAAGKVGPVQAIIAFDETKKEERGFTLLYNYLGLIYRYASGVIVGMAVLFVIVGGIQMTTSAGDTTKFDGGKKRIIQAITGMLVWFLASLILYTINPTFFAF